MTNNDVVSKSHVTLFTKVEFLAFYQAILICYHFNLYMAQRQPLRYEAVMMFYDDNSDASYQNCFP